MILRCLVGGTDTSNYRTGGVSRGFGGMWGTLGSVVPSLGWNGCEDFVWPARAPKEPFERYAQPEK
jgi:hypothetical protein